MNDFGKSAARAVITAGIDALHLDAGQREIPDPPIGAPRNGLEPGTWLPGPPAMPPDCPVGVLGIHGKNIFLIDVLGQLFVIDGKLGQDEIAKLFGNRQNYLYWAWPRRAKNGSVDGWRAEKVRESLYTAAAEKGIWNAVEKVRGLGAWKDSEGNLLLHCGKYLWSGGKLMKTGERDGFFYPRRPASHKPWDAPVPHSQNPARDVYRALQTWTWGRPDVDPFLLLGWMGAAMLGGALPWRPSMFLTGDKAVGKSTLQELVKAVLGDGLISTPDTTPAGIYQRIGNDALPIAVDELEAEADGRKAIAVIKLARLAASGGVMLRGGSDHKGVEFQARSCFLFSAINPPPLPPQDLSRLAVLNLGKLDPQKIERKPSLSDVGTIGSKFLRRLADGWPHFTALFDDYRAALREGGHDSRGQDTYGIFLTCAHILLGDEGCDEFGLPMENLVAWGHRLSAASLPEKEDAHENWRACLTHLLTSRVETWQSGERKTVGQLLEDAFGPTPVAGLDRQYAKRQLAQAGLGIIEPPKVRGYALAVPSSGPLVSALYRGTPWGGEGGTGVWRSALRQGPPHIISADKSINNCRINGVMQRCTLVMMDEFAQLDAE